MIYFVPLRSMNFHLTSKYKPTGDQPEAIRELTDGLNRGDHAQVLLGVTGSGKTFTVANVIANVEVDMSLIFSSFVICLLLINSLFF